MKKGEEELQSTAKKMHEDFCFLLVRCYYRSPRSLFSPNVRFIESSS